MKLGVTVILFAFCVFYSQLTFSQGALKSNNLDSLLSSLDNPIQKVDAIIKILEEPENQYMENAEELANRALEISQQTNYALGKVNSMLILGNYYYRSSDYTKAMELAQASKELSEDFNFDDELGASYSIIGTIYTELGDYDKSSQYYFKSLKIFEKLGNKDGIAHAFGDIGKDFYNQKDYSKALQYFSKSLLLATQNQNLLEIKRQYNNIAATYGLLMKYDTSIVYLRKALAISTKIGDKFGQGINVMNIGYNQLNKGDIEEALESFSEALALFTGLDNRLHMAKCYLNFGFCYYSTNQISEGIVYFKKALTEGQKNGYYEVIATCANMLNKIYAVEKDTINAYNYLMLEKLAGDSIFAKKKQILVSKFELQYVTEKKEFERQKAQQAKNIVIMIIIFTLIAGLVVLGLVISKLRLKSKFVIIAKEKIELAKEKIELELVIKDKELTVNLISLIKKNELLTDISKKLAHLEFSASGKEARDTIAKISQELRNSTNDKMFTEFSSRFQEVHAGFYEKLLQAHPELTQNELKLCAFLRLNMSSKDIAELTGQQITAIDKARFRLRGKLNLPNSKTNLVTFLSQI